MNFLVLEQAERKGISVAGTELAIFGRVVEKLTLTMVKLKTVLAKIAFFAVKKFWPPKVLFCKQYTVCKMTKNNDKN